MNKNKKSKLTHHRHRVFWSCIEKFEAKNSLIATNKVMWSIILRKVLETARHTISSYGQESVHLLSLAVI
jgi:hypothetical protein